MGVMVYLKKIDRIMANIEFQAEFAGAVAVFQPFRISDHAPAILWLPRKAKFVPRPFKFSNVLVHNTSFAQVVAENWKHENSGFQMFQVVKRLKALKKPLRKLMFDKGNLHNKVTVLRHELDEVQQALDLLMIVFEKNRLRTYMLIMMLFWMRNVS